VDRLSQPVRGTYLAQRARPAAGRVQQSRQLPARGQEILAESQQPSFSRAELLQTARRSRAAERLRRHIQNDCDQNQPVYKVVVAATVV